MASNMEHDEYEQLVIPNYECRDFKDIATQNDLIKDIVETRLVNIEIRFKKKKRVVLLWRFGDGNGILL